MTTSWEAKYDQDTGQHLVFCARSGELICCVGNLDMGLSRQSALARAIAQMAPEIVTCSQGQPAEGGA